MPSRYPVFGRVAATFPVSVDESAVVSALERSVRDIASRAVARPLEWDGVAAAIHVTKVHKAVMSIDFAVEASNGEHQAWLKVTLPQLLDSSCGSDLHSELVRCISELHQHTNNAGVHNALQCAVSSRAGVCQLTDEELCALEFAGVDAVVGEAIRETVTNVLRDSTTVWASLPPLAQKRALREALAHFVHCRVFPFASHDDCAPEDASIYHGKPEGALTAQHEGTMSALEHQITLMKAQLLSVSKSFEESNAELRSEILEANRHLAQARVEAAHWKQRADEADLALMLNMPSEDEPVHGAIVSTQQAADERLAKLLEVREQQVRSLCIQLLQLRKENVDLKRRGATGSPSPSLAGSRSGSIDLETPGVSRSDSTSGASTCTNAADTVPLAAVRALEIRCEEAERELRDRTKQIATLLLEHHRFNDDSLNH